MASTAGSGIVNTPGSHSDRSLAYLLLRVVLGINIAVHGFSRLYSGPAAFAEAMVSMFAKTPLPAWSVHAFAMCLPWVEALVGLLVLFGAASRLAYVIGMLEIAALTFGSALRQDWDAAGLQLTYALIYAVLLATREYNGVSVDGLFRRGSRASGSLTSQGG
jgi:thiosulfate dehydrogenase (quinone) large subunit